MEVIPDMMSNHLLVLIWVIHSLSLFSILLNVQVQWTSKLKRCNRNKKGCGNWTIFNNTIIYLVMKKNVQFPHWIPALFLLQRFTWPPFPCNRLRCVSFGTIFVDWTSLKIFVNIIGYIEKAKTLTVTWFRFFLGCIFISDSCLLTIAIAFWPIAPWTTVTSLVVVARAVWYWLS